IVRRTELPHSNEPNSGKRRETALFAVVYPPLLRLVVPAWMQDFVFDIRSDQYAALFNRVMLAASVLAAVGALMLSRRYGMSWGRASAWSLTTLCVGPAALVPLVGLNTLPARERCPLCA